MRAKYWITRLVPALCTVVFGGALSVAQAQTIYKYRDVDGHWVYTDRKPDLPSAAAVPLKAIAKAPRIFIERVRDGERSALRAVNECVCVVEFGVHITEPINVTVPGTGSYRATVPPRSERVLLEISPTGNGIPSYGYDWLYVYGTPGARHAPLEAYRAPFALGQSFQVTQAFPSRYTHTDPASEYAIDFDMPEGTPVHAARAGTVINVAYDHFRNGTDPALVDQANFIEIVHDDETVGIYAHLQWDSIRVHPGDRVQRGEYIANSGNTGFSTGPHLHFAVIRNAGLKPQSVPITFASAHGAGVIASEGMKITAR